MANGMATAAAAVTGSPAAIEMGTAAPANASDADTSACHDFSSPRMMAAIKGSAATTGRTSDQRAAGSMATSAHDPLATPTMRQ